MSFQSWLQNLRSALAPGRGHRNQKRRGSLRAATHRLHLEALEDRRLLAFLTPVDYVVGSYPSEVTAGDFNRDSVLDLATANFGDSTVSVLLGSANGSFQPAQTSTSVPNAQSVAVGDFNADGMLDLATGNYDDYDTGDNDVSILLGNGDGTFDAAVPLSISYGASWFIATGDLNADDKLDLVVTENPNLDSFGSSTMRVLLGHGDGTFAPAAYYSPNDVLVDLYSPVLADFNRDGNTDVAVPVSGWQAGLVKVFLGNSDGTLQQPRNVVTYSAASYAATNSVTVGDFNGDGRLDLATDNYNNSASVLLGNGDGTFQAAQSIAAAAVAAAAGDVNGDGMCDLVATNASGVSVFLSNGDGSFALPITTATGSSPVSVVVADFNANGRLDAAVANADSNTVSVLLNDGKWPSPDLPQPRISINNVTKNEGANNKTTLFTFTVTLSAASDQSVTVNYATANLTATAGSDYLSKTGTVTFAPGETTKTIAISVKGDKTKEADETFFVNLANASGARIDDGQGLGTILDDDGGALLLTLATDLAMSSEHPGRRR